MFKNKNSCHLFLKFSQKKDLKTEDALKSPDS